MQITAMVSQYYLEYIARLDQSTWGLGRDSSLLSIKGEKRWQMFIKSVLVSLNIGIFSLRFTGSSEGDTLELMNTTFFNRST